jgi:serine/threonine-protein kinase HipA
VVDDGERLLVVLIGGRRAGVITMDLAGRLSLTYDEVWRDTRNATPLSLSMPIAQLEHGDTPVRAFLWGLLPDNERVLEHWAQTYHVSARNLFALLRHVGEDCAGAAQFATPERVDALMAGDGDVRWLNADDIAERLRVLRNDPTAWHVYNTGQFSLTTRMPDAFATAAKSKAVRALRSRLPSRLVERIAARAADCRKCLQQ